MKNYIVLSIIIVIVIALPLYFLVRRNKNFQYIAFPKTKISKFDKSLFFDRQDCSEIRINSDKIQILQLTDIHYDHNNNKKAQTTDLINDVISRTNPDIIMVTGDWTSQRVDTLSHINKVFSTIDAHNIPWAVALGNHDSEGEVKRADYINILYKYTNCLFKAGFSNIGGVGNYVIKVINSKNNQLVA